MKKPQACRKEIKINETNFHFTKLICLDLIFNEVVGMKLNWRARQVDLESIATGNHVLVTSFMHEFRELASIVWLYNIAYIALFFFPFIIFLSVC